MQLYIDLRNILEARGWASPSLPGQKYWGLEPLEPTKSRPMHFS